MPKSSIARNRIVYGWLTISVLLIGLVSRRFLGEFSFVKLYVGDGLWALMVFFGFGFTFSRWSTQAIAAVALGFSFSIELSQLYHAPLIDSLRATRLGGLMLGYTFLWSDLLSYSVGVGVGVVIETLFIPARYQTRLILVDRKKITSSENKAFPEPD